MSAIIHIRNHKNDFIKARALLDTCATANFISESIVKRLGSRITEHSSRIGAINTTSTVASGLVKITIQSRMGDFSKELTCLTIPVITDLIPSETFPRETIEIPSNIRLADPEFHLPRPVDILIGSGATLSLFSVGQINLSRDGHDLYLQKTRLGWVVAGCVSVRSVSKPTCYLTTLEDQLSRFWDLEEIVRDKPKTSEEIECETHFLKTVHRDNTGRYTVRLPFREINKSLGESRVMAIKRLSSLERKFSANPTLKVEYARVIKEYLDLGHMSIVEKPSDVFICPTTR